MRKREEAALVLACAPIEDALQEAKSGGDVRARRAAMATMHETRAWLRAKGELQRLPGEIAELKKALKSARLATDEKAAERVSSLEEQIAGAQARLARIQAQFGPLVQAMDELATVGGEV